jgi:hypothetical protein
VLIAETGPVTERLRVREIDDDEGRHLLRIVRRGTGSVVTWRKAQMVLLSAQGMAVAAIAKVAEFLVAEEWSRTSATRACAPCSARRASPFNA